MPKVYNATESTFDLNDLEKTLKNKANGRNWLSWSDIYEAGYTYMASMQFTGKIREYEQMLLAVVTPENPSNPKGGRWYFNDPS